jgi:hypothetical protein
MRRGKMNLIGPFEIPAGHLRAPDERHSVKTDSGISVPSAPSSLFDCSFCIIMDKRYSFDKGKSTGRSVHRLKKYCGAIWRTNGASEIG